MISMPLYATSSTNKKIKKSEESLDTNAQNQKEVNDQLEQIAKDIKKANNANSVLNKKLESLSSQYSKNEKVYKKSKNELFQYDRVLTQINQKIINEHDKFIKILANQSSIIYAMNQSHDPSRESIVMQEAYGLLKEQNSRELAELKRQIDQNKAQKRKITKRRKSAKERIDKIAKQKKDYEKQRITKRKLVKKLSKDEDQYRKKLQKAMDKQNALRSTLADLNILKKKEVENERRIAAEQKALMIAQEKRKRKERKERELARKKARKKGTKVVYTAKTETKATTNRNIRKVGSSYTKNKVSAYYGGKTISPIRGAKVVKTFGTYIDPIYKIKIFNESITLKAPTRNAKVKNVLNGKVVFAGSSSMLGKVVVVSHKNKIHTIYAGLSKISPEIKKGRKIKKGYVVGKVSRKLIFEATKNSKHINPMKMIRL